MSVIDDFKNDFIYKIRTLSQEQGMRDNEIAEAMGCSRATINRVRQTYDIPTANLRNRQDKECFCESCRKAYAIKRKERRKKLCDDCAKAAKESLQP